MKRGFALPAIRALLLVTACLFAAPAAAQFGINLDLDISSGTPNIGFGVPSDSFGAAANQPGRWNRVVVSDPGPTVLSGLDGLATSVVFSKLGGDGGVGFNFTANTGSYALLLNDAATVGSSLQGGSISYSFAGFHAGLYDIYTYALQTAGGFLSEPVEVPEATSNQIQIVTGPMPGNSFQYLVTHSVHHVLLPEGGSIHVNLTQPPGLPNGFVYQVNGFQIVAVPEPETLPATTLLCMIVLGSRIARTRRKGY